MSDVARNVGWTVKPKVRTVDAHDLQLTVEEDDLMERVDSAPDTPRVDFFEPKVTEILGLLERFSGVILSGPPGTSKTHWATMAGKVLAGGDPSRLVVTQFHASYQYEDFIEGYRPAPPSGFEHRWGVFMELCERADSDSPDTPYAIVIDELSRGDAARIFGEALTYIEREKRGVPFTLPSGKISHIPRNIKVIATMNPQDRGVDEVDAAFERRFAKIALNPDADLLRQRLATNQVDEALAENILKWFRMINGRARENPAAALGHAFLWHVVDEDTLADAWRYQIEHHVRRAFRLDETAADAVVAAWEDIAPPSST